jgi:ATP-dependent RNA helicase RhlE
VERISDNFLLFPSRLEVSPPATPANTVAQWVYPVPNFKAKLQLLVRMLKDREEYKRVMIFVSTKDIATQIAKYLERIDVGEVRFLHSNKGQNARMNAIDDFKSGDVRVLVSTDVSARGIDVTEVSHVINFNIPTQYDDYVHRIGRTGRAFKTGTAISFMDVSEEYHVKKIEELIKQPIARVDLPAEIVVEKTPFDEHQDQMREIDRQKRLEDPDFKGAFHEKKNPRPPMKKPVKKAAAKPISKGGKTSAGPARPKKKGKRWDKKKS